VAARLAAVHAALQPLLEGLQAWMRGQPPAGAVAAANPAAGPQGLDPDATVRYLQGLLERDDPAAPEFFQHNAPVLQHVLGSAFALVQTHTLNFDFEQALEALAAAPDPEHSAVQTP
jgi:two-component system sensor histidine kinase/response regulator